MNLSVSFVFVLGVLLGVLRTADLMFGTDMATGLCVVGSVWWRYLALGIAVLAAVLCVGMAALGGWALVLAALAVLWRYHAVSRKQFGGITGDLAGWFLQKAELWMLAALCACQWGGLL